MSLSLTPLDWFVCLTTVVASIAIGLYVAVRTHAAEDSANFFLAGRRLTWPIIGASLFATNIGAEHLVGLSGDSYRYGLRAATVELATVLSIGVAAALLVPHYIRNQIFTIPEFLEMRYNRTARALFSGLMLVICVMTKMAFSLFAGALVIHGLFGWDVMTVVAALGIVAGIITMIGGFTTVAYTDSIQALIMIFGCGLMLLFGLDKVGGWSGLVATAPEAMKIAAPYDDPNFPFWGIVIGAALWGTFYWGVDQVTVQRVLGARNLQQARWGSMFAILLKLTPVFLFAVPGVIAFALFPGREAKTTFVTLLNELLPTGLRGLVLAALLAALVSSLLAVMNSISTLVVRDFVLHFRPNTGEAAQVHLGRVAIAVATVLGVAAAYLIYRTPDGLYRYLQAISIYLTMPVVPAILFGIISKRVTVRGAVASVLAGVALAAIFVADQMMGAAGETAFPWLHTTFTLNYTYRGMVGLLSSTAILFAISSVTAQTSPERLQKTTLDWDAPAERFHGLSDWRLQLAGLTLATASLYAWLW